MLIQFSQNTDGGVWSNHRNVPHCGIRVDRVVI